MLVRLAAARPRLVALEALAEVVLRHEPALDEQLECPVHGRGPDGTRPPLRHPARDVFGGDVVAGN